MPSKPLKLRILGNADTSEIVFLSFDDKQIFDTWLSEHGWKAFQDYRELQEVKNDTGGA